MEYTFLLKASPVENLFENDQPQAVVCTLTSEWLYNLYLFSGKMLSELSNDMQLASLEVNPPSECAFINRIPKDKLELLENTPFIFIKKEEVDKLLVDSEFRDELVKIRLYFYSKPFGFSIVGYMEDTTIELCCEDDLMWANFPAVCDLILAGEKI